MQCNAMKKNNESKGNIGLGMNLDRPSNS